MTHRRQGFTLIELMIAMVIIVILMALAVINLRSSQANARDAKRAGDIATIARGLETRYSEGFSAPSAGWLTSTNSSCTMVDYPSTEEIVYALGNADPGICFTNPTTAASNFIVEDLPGTASDSYTPPNIGTFKPICSTSCAANTAEGSGVTAASIGDNYVYEPLDASGKVCYLAWQDCVRYNLYYVSEVDGVLHTIRSKHQ